MFGHEPVDHLRQLTTWEQEYANRPPTPPRPQLRPSLNQPVWGFDSMEGPREEDLPEVPESGDVGDGRAQTPPRVNSKFFLSDHFGLVATLQPVSS